MLSASSRTSPLMRTRANPSATSPDNSLTWVPFLPRTTGASSWKRVPSGRVMIWSTIWSMVSGRIGRSHWGQWGSPARPNSSRR